MRNESSIQIICPHCGHLDSGNYCSNCGESINGELSGWVRESAHELMPLRVLSTLRNLLFDYRSFFSEAIASNWSKKTKPVPYFIACTLVALFLGALFGSPSSTVTWSELYNYTDEESDDPVLFEALGLDYWDFIDIDRDMLYAGTSEASQQVRSVVGSVEADMIINFIHEKGAKDDNEEYLALSSKLGTILSKINKENEFLHSYHSVILPLSLLLGIWLAGSNIIKTSTVDRTSSFRVLCYVMGTSMLFYTIVEIPLWHFTQDGYITHNVVTLMLIPLIILLYKVLKHTHGIGFWKGQWAMIASSLVGATAIFFATIPAVYLTETFVWQ